MISFHTLNSVRFALLLSAFFFFKQRSSQWGRKLKTMDGGFKTAKWWTGGSLLGSISLPDLGSASSIWETGNTLHDSLSLKEDHACHRAHLSSREIRLKMIRGRKKKKKAFAHRPWPWHSVRQLASGITYELEEHVSEQARTVYQTWWGG